MKLSFSPQDFLKKNFQWILFLLIAHIISTWAIENYQLYKDFTLAPLFYFDKEKNIPSLYSSLLLLSAGLLNYFIASVYQARKLPYRAWLGLAVIMCFLGIDEFATLHEELTPLVRMSLGTSGIFYYAWVIPYGIGVLIFGITYLRFLYHLPPRTRKLFILAGSLYVFGALGFELAGGLYDEIYPGHSGFLHALLITCEEIFEMVGMTTFVYALLDYIVNHFSFVEITLHADQPSSATRKAVNALRKSGG